MTWWQEPFRIFQTNLREIDAVMDVEKVLDDLESFHANAWLLNTGGIVSFYPSKLPYQHVNPWLGERPSGDLIADAIDAAHRRGIKVISRVDFSKQHRDIYEAHPDWFAVNLQGEPQVYNGLYSLCPSGTYYQEHSFRILAEILDNYDNDAFFFNMFGFAQYDYSRNYHGICQCANCQRRFYERYGKPLPQETDWTNPAYIDYLDFRAWTAKDLATRISAFIRQRKPNIPLVLFWHAGQGDVIMHEINNAINRPLPYWVYEAGERVKRTNGTYPGMPVTLNSVLFLDIPYRFVAEQAPYIGLRLAQTLAHGANPYVYVLGTTEQMDRRNQTIVREMYAFHAENADDYAGLMSPAKIALVNPTRSQSRYQQGENNSQDAFRGFYRALVETHAQFNIFEEDQIAMPDRLTAYELVILPAVACLSDAAVAALDAFVQDGGRLIVTGPTAVCDEYGHARRELPLQSLGIKAYSRAREDMRGAYFRLNDEKHAYGAFRDMDVMGVLGTYFYAAIKNDAVTRFTMIPPHPFGPPEKCYWDEETDWPGVIEFAFGEGSTVVLPWQPDVMYYTMCLPEYRDLLGAIIAQKCAPMLKTDAGPVVEAVVRDQPSTGRRIVHLINYSGQNGRTFNEAIPLHDITLSVQVNGTVSRVRSARLKIDLPFQLDDQTVTFKLSHLGLFDKIVIE